MRVTTTTLALVATAALLGAQQVPAKPYQEGGVHSFLEQARKSGRPALVLFNFDLESG